MFSSRWVSVRQAFLDLDLSRRGLIEAADILRLLGGANRLIDYDSLHKIMQDNSNDKTGELNYHDFCRWMGPSLRETSSLNFRHDSSTNPEFQSYMETTDEKMKTWHNNKVLMTRDQIEK